MFELAVPDTETNNKAACGPYLLHCKSLYIEITLKIAYYSMKRVLVKCHQDVLKKIFAFYLPGASWRYVVKCVNFLVGVRYFAQLNIMHFKIIFAPNLNSVKFGTGCLFECHRF